MGQMIVKWWGRGSISRGSHPCPSVEDEYNCLRAMLQVLHIWFWKGIKHYTLIGFICLAQYTLMPKPG